MTNLKIDFICKICDKIRKDPIFLPCNCSSICLEHVQTKNRIASITCQECQRNFEIPQQDSAECFKENKLMRNLIENDSYLTQNEKELKLIAESKLLELERLASNLNTKINEFILTQNDHFNNIKNEVDIKRETLIQNLYQANQEDIESVNYILDEVNGTSAEMIAQIEQTEEGFRKNFEQIKLELTKEIDFWLHNERLKFQACFREPTLTAVSIQTLINDYDTKQANVLKRIKNFRLFEYDLVKNKFQTYTNSKSDFRSFGRLELYQKYHASLNDEIQNVFATHWNTKEISLFNLNTNSIVQSLQGHTDGIWCLILYDESSKLITASEDTSIKIWDIKSCECIQTLLGHSREVYCLKILKNEKLASGANDNKIKIWDLTKFVCLLTLEGHREYVMCLEELSDGWLVSGSGDLTLILWPLDENKEHSSVFNAHARGIRCLKLLPKGSFASGSDDSKVKIWTGDCLADRIPQCIKSLTGHGGSVYNLELTATGDLLISCSFDSSIRVWNWNEGVCVRQLNGHEDSVYCIKLNKTTGELLSASKDDCVKVWNLTSGDCVRSIQANFSIWNLEVSV